MRTMLHAIALSAALALGPAAAFAADTITVYKDPG